MDIYVINWFYALFQIKIQIFIFFTIKVNILLTVEYAGVNPFIDNGGQKTIWLYWDPWNTLSKPLFNTQSLN